MNLRASERPRVLIVGADPVLFALFAEWLSAVGIEAHDDVQASCDVVLVDVAFPRVDGCERMRSLMAMHDGRPVVALSAAFFAHVDRDGGCARQLGVAAVLPKPVAREALLDTVRRLLRVAS
ncbi:MAG: response regulator [Burkholderiaceae bacterium]|nr:response regulator [Burkholderiaceae bacterium]